MDSFERERMGINYIGTGDPIDPPKPGTGTSTGNAQGTLPNGLPNGVDLPPIQLEEVVITREKNSNITGDGIKVWGVGGDPVAGSGDMKGDRGSGSMDMPGHDYNSLFDFGQLIGDFINWVTGNSNSAPTTTNATTMSTSVPETVTAQRYDYTSTDAFGGNQSMPHAGYPRDTIVRRGSESIVNRLNTKDSLRAAKQSRIKNAEHKRKYGY